ncbi:Acetyl-coenzyme A synthetase [compost metagenome]
MPDALRGQVVKAFVVSARPGDDAFVEEIQNTVRSQLAQHEYPRQVVFVPELPKTPAGKIHRRKLREQELANAAASTTDTPKAAPAAHV